MLGESKLLCAVYQQQHRAPSGSIGRGLALGGSTRLAIWGQENYLTPFEAGGPVHQTNRMPEVAVEGASMVFCATPTS